MSCESLEGRFDTIGDNFFRCVKGFKTDSFISGREITSDISTINLSPSLAMPIFLRLGIRSIPSLSRVDHIWHRISNDNVLWEKLFIRDFGKDAFQRLNCCQRTDYKAEYQKNHTKIKKLIDLFPEGVLLLASKDEEPTKSLFGVISKENFYNLLIQELTNMSDFQKKSALEEFFKRSLQVNCNLFVEAIVKSKQITGLPSHFVFMLAAYADDEEEMKKIISDETRFSDIMANGQHGLGRAITEAVRVGNISVLQLLANNRRFDEISIEGAYGLGDAFVSAAQVGNVLAMKVLMENKRFELIPVNDSYYGLSRAFFNAAKAGEVLAMQQIADCSRFSEIKVEGECGIREAFIEAMRENKIQAMAFIVYSMAKIGKLDSFFSTHFLNSLFEETSKRKKCDDVKVFLLSLLMKMDCKQTVLWDSRPKTPPPVTLSFIQFPQKDLKLRPLTPPPSQTFLLEPNLNVREGFGL